MASLKKDKQHVRKNFGKWSFDKVKGPVCKIQECLLAEYGKRGR